MEEKQATKKNPKRVKAGQKGAAARKAKHEEVLERLRKSKEEVLEKVEVEVPAPRPPDHEYINPTYIAAVAFVVICAGGAAYYYYYFDPQQSVTLPQKNEVQKSDPFHMG